jgi:hypothetical protein
VSCEREVFSWLGSGLATVGEYDISYFSFFLLEIGVLVEGIFFGE